MLETSAKCLEGVSLARIASEEIMHYNFNKTMVRIHCIQFTVNE